jgi:hypothetical protein
MHEENTDMNVQRIIWLVCIVAALSAAVSVAIVCVVVPIVTGPKTAAEEPAQAAASHADSFAVLSNDLPDSREVEADRRAASEIKKRLGINLYSGTVFDSAEGTANIEALGQSQAEEVAFAELSAASERLRAEGQHRAAQIVQTAADKLKNSTARRDASDRATK